MFYVFFVNKGYMLILEPPALGSVYDLQRCIADSTRVDIQNQILFLSGGSSVTSREMLSTYADAGTDTNPMFLVHRIPTNDREFVNTPERDGIVELYQTWKAKVEKLEKVPANTAAGGTAAINEYIDLGKVGIHVADMIIKFCAKIVSEHQHLNQGWMAVIANLDDNITRIEKRLDRARIQAERLGTLQEKGRSMLSDFNQVLHTLTMITIPTILLSPLTPGQQNPSDSDTSADEVTLYEWISSKDPVFSLDNLVGHVLDHLEKTDDSDLVEAQKNFKSVSEFSKTSQYRDISGIDKRLAILDAKLRSLEENHPRLRELAARIIQPPIQDSTQNVVNFQRSRVIEFSEPLKVFHEYALCFIDSKLELLTNISQRFSGWVRRSYEHLQKASKLMVLFDDKFTGLRNRLDLTRQIKEAPLIYMTAVTEVIRREALQKEFNAWMNQHVEKCSSFISEENKIRKGFYAKLEKHFLRQLFAGMSDQVPNFAANLPIKIDLCLPKVPVNHLRELRKTFSEMRELLRVSTPQVFIRLSVIDANLQASHLGLRREESFLVRDRASNINTLSQNFPSSNWLNEENVDGSPATNNFLMPRIGFSSQISLNAGVDEGGDQTPSELGPLCEFPEPSQSGGGNAGRSSMSPLKASAPITIPQQQVQSRGGSSECHFSTPDDNTFGCFDTRFASMKGSLITANLSSPKITRPRSLRQTDQSPVVVESLGFFEQSHRQSVASFPSDFVSRCAFANYSLGQFANDFSDLRKSLEDWRQMVGEQSSADIVSLNKEIAGVQLKVQKEFDELNAKNEERIRDECSKLATKYQEQNKELSEILEHERYLRKEKERELEEQKIVVLRLNDDLLAQMKGKDDLHADLIKLEQERRSLSEQLEQQATDYLTIELEVMEQLMKRSLTVEEKQQIEAEIVKRKTFRRDLTGQQEATTTSTIVGAIAEESVFKNEYEKAYKNKMALIVKGVEERKNKEIATLRKELEAEIRLESEAYLEKMKQRIAQLEDKVRLYDSLDAHSSHQHSPSIQQSFCQTMTESEGTETENNTSLQMQESCIVLNSDATADSATQDEDERKASLHSRRPSGTATSEQQSRNPDAKSSDKGGATSADDEDGGIAPLMTVYSCGTQTRIRMRDMRMMVALSEIHEGCAALLMWDGAHNAYIAFCIGTTLHFVKDGCLQALGIRKDPSKRQSSSTDPSTSSTPSPPQRSWMFALVQSIETCQIKKPTNRYNLPINTRFNRIAVVPLPDFPNSSASSISSSRRC